MIVFVEETARLLPLDLQRELDNAVEAARLAGALVYSIPHESWDGEKYSTPFSLIPFQRRPTPALRMGYFSSFESYQAIYEAAAQKNIVLLNTPEQHQIIEEFDLAYPFLEGLAPRVLIFHSLEEALDGAQQLGFPIFVKGAVRKRIGAWKRPPIARDMEELRVLCAPLCDSDEHPLVRVVLREEVSLRHSRSVLDFPMGRLFCLLLFKSEILASSYYWDEEDQLDNLSSQERQAVEDLAQTAALRLPAPYVAIYVGQLESGDWIITDTGDPQFIKFPEFNRMVSSTFWNRLESALPT